MRYKIVHHSPNLWYVYQEITVPMINMFGGLFNRNRWELVQGFNSESDAEAAVGRYIANDAYNAQVQAQLDQHVVTEKIYGP